MDASIRRAKIEDLDLLAPLFDAYRQFYMQPSDPGLARSFLSERFIRGESVIFLALDSTGSALGFTQLYPSCSSGLAKPIFVLNDLFVVPAARRRQIGRQLLRAAAEFGNRAGAASLTLSTALDNSPARELYESSGWHRDTLFCTYTLPLDR